MTSPSKESPRSLREVALHCAELAEFGPMHAHGLETAFAAGWNDGRRRAAETLRAFASTLPDAAVEEFRAHGNAAQGEAVAWMIERPVDGRAAWWTGAHADHFDHDPNQGIRFSRHQDAFWIARKNVNQPYTITEHEWLDTASPQPSGGKVAEGWKLVPIVPTDAMCYAACGSDQPEDQEMSASTYRAMLAAAPSHSGDEGER